MSAGTAALNDVADVALGARTTHDAGKPKPKVPLGTMMARGRDTSTTRVPPFVRDNRKRHENIVAAGYNLSELERASECSLQGIQHTASSKEWSASSEHAAINKS